MTTYWAQEDWPTKAAHVHRADCRYCNNGHGWQPGRTGQNNAWYGPFTTPEEARAACQRADAEPCGTYACQLRPGRRSGTPMLGRQALGGAVVERFAERCVSRSFCGLSVSTGSDRIQIGPFCRRLQPARLRTAPALLCLLSVSPNRSSVMRELRMFCSISGVCGGIGPRDALPEGSCGDHVLDEGLAPPFDALADRYDDNDQQAQTAGALVGLVAPANAGPLRGNGHGEVSP